MQYIDFSKNDKHVYFIGIGGISMSGLAELLMIKGFSVSGSDNKKSDIVNHLISKGISFNLGQRAENITDDIDLVVYTAAVKDDNAELMAAREKNITAIDRATLLGNVINYYNLSIGVSGTHGKTTTTSMISHIALAGQKDPTINLGGILDIINGNMRIGHSEYFIFEACEYCDSFLKFFPHIGVILNIDEDHLDYFKDINHILDSFHKYATNIPSDGYLVIDGDIDDIHKVTDGLECTVLTVGINDDKYSFTAKNIEYINGIYPKFDVYNQGDFIVTVTLSVPGEHNIKNALCAVASSIKTGIDLQSIQEGLLSFKGTHRRFEYKGTLGGITVIDDYAHHPTEIKATLNAANSYPHNKIWCVFQPHTYTRTKALLKEFADALTLADTILLSDIYAAREKNTGDIHSKDLETELKNLEKDVHYFPSFDEIEKYILENCSNQDILITMGAGDICQVGEELLGL